MAGWLIGRPFGVLRLTARLDIRGSENEKTVKGLRVRTLNVTSTVGCKETQNSALGSNGGGARVSDSQGKAHNTSAAKL